MTSPSKTVRVETRGLDQFRRELRKLDNRAEIEDKLKDTNKQVADVVVVEAQLRAFTPLQRKAAQSLKSGRQLARAVVSGGGARYPFFGGAEFGAIQYHQFEPWRGSGRDAGYFLYPAIRDITPELVDMYGDKIEQLARSAFPD